MPHPGRGHTGLDDPACRTRSRARLASMPAAIPDALRAEVTAALRAAGASFALLHGSRVTGRHRPDSDVDVAAWWPGDAPASFDITLPAGIDVVVLNGAPLELAGRIAMDGELLFDDDPPARVRWVATTRKIYADEQPRLLRSHRD